MKSVFWFRQDLRLDDNPGLIAAAKEGSVLPIYILDDESAGFHKMGEASRWWLHRSLEKLRSSLEGKLAFFKGDPLTILKKLIDVEGIDHVYWNRCYEPWRIKRDTRIKEALGAKTFNGSLLWEPWDVLKKDGAPFKVFTPYYKSHRAPREPLGHPEKLELIETELGEPIDLLPKSKWIDKLQPLWEVGEEGAKKRLEAFIKEGLEYYKGGRDFPARPYVSRLSPHLHFGEISPHFVWRVIEEVGEDDNTLHFHSELGWREFSYYLLYHFPDLPDKNFQKKFDSFPWKKDPETLRLWQKGQTGVPFVDAAMRELWQTGYMHNRMRMVVGSFLVKNLLIHWHEGEAWFWDCLVDADLASNSASWQWVAGSGADAAPYFRIFNCVTQGEKFDPEGEYTRRYVPELKDLPSKYLFAPWTAPKEVLEKAGVELGKTYPHPIVDLKKSREEALEVFKGL